MKVTLSITNFRPSLGYTNIDLLPDPNALKDKLVEQGKPTQLDRIQNNTVEELQLKGILSTISIKDLDKAIEHWKSKLKVGASVMIDDIDFAFVAQKLFNNDLPIQQFNDLCYGTGPLIRAGMHTLLSIEDSFKKQGFETDFKTYDNNACTFVLKMVIK